MKFKSHQDFSEYIAPNTFINLRRTIPCDCVQYIAGRQGSHFPAHKSRNINHNVTTVAFQSTTKYNWLLHFGMSVVYKLILTSTHMGTVHNYEVITGDMQRHTSEYLVD